MAENEHGVVVGRRFGSVGHAWFQLTAMEQKAVAVVLALALLGVAAKYWHSRRTADRMQSSSANGLENR